MTRKKLAIFVEGQTEQIFVKKLISEIAEKNNVCFQLEKGKWGNKQARRFDIIEGANQSTNQLYYVLIRDCGTDSRVKSDIKDNIEKLRDSGFEKVIGLLDIYPKQHSEIVKLIQYKMYQIPTRFLPVSIIFAVMEIEAWFIAETSHFKQVHPSLELEHIKEKLNLSLDIAKIEAIRNPSSELNSIYKLGGSSYNKSKEKVQKVVDMLDYEVLYMDIQNELRGLNLLITDIESFL